MSDGQLGAWRVGTPVLKPKGYPFPGVVRSAFTNTAGDLRYVVESTVAPGMLHIFAPAQLEYNGEPDASA